MKKKPIIFIEHILESIEDIESFSKGLSKNNLTKNKVNQYAVIRAIEIIGEAVKNLPMDFRNKYSDIPWTKITGMRDKLMHHYFGINLEIVWKVIKEDVPDLKKKLLKIKEDFD